MVKDYLLFVDTETSGLPQDWHKPYSAEGNWPYIVQVAWIIYTRDGKEVKRENHFIKNTDYKISDISREIHGISDQFLDEHGKERKEVMQLMYNDLLHYQPLMVGHFMQLDYHMLGLGFYRAGLDNPLKQLPTFCTMMLTKDFVQAPGHKYLRLHELYLRLFRQPLQQHHNALVDAGATASCFFELWKRGELNEQMIIKQQQFHDTDQAQIQKKNLSYLYFALLALLLFFLIIFWLV